jgi:hypothetical protein
MAVPRASFTHRLAGVHLGRGGGGIVQVYLWAHGCEWACGVSTAPPPPAVGLFCLGLLRCVCCVLCEHHGVTITVRARAGMCEWGVGCWDVKCGVRGFVGICWGRPSLFLACVTVGPPPPPPGAGDH